MFRLAHTVAAAKSEEGSVWAVADGLALDFKEAHITPLISHFKEAAELLEERGMTYDPGLLQRYWRVASTFNKSRRKAGVSLRVYDEVTQQLWSRLDPETRSNDLVGYATQFFAEKGAKAGGVQARAWTKSQVAGIEAERKAALAAKAKEKAKDDLAELTPQFEGQLAAGNLERATALLGKVNDLRRRLGMDLLMIDLAPEQPAVTTDVVATEQAAQETEEEAAKRLHDDATSLWEKDSALCSMHIRRLGHTTRKVSDYFTEEDREVYAEELDTQIAQLQLIRQNVAGSIADGELEKALAEWSLAE